MYPIAKPKSEHYIFVPEFSFVGKFSKRKSVLIAKIELI